jgi:hypothetical protein
MLPVLIFNRALATKTEGEWGYHPPLPADLLEPQGGGTPKFFLFYKCTTGKDILFL